MTAERAEIKKLELKSRIASASSALSAVKQTDSFEINSFYFKTFARVCLLPYIGGVVIHILRLIYDFPITEIPVEVDWVVVIVGGYAGLGLIMFAHKIPFKNIWDKIAYGLLIFHLDGSVILHIYLLYVGNHRALGIFPYWYSFLAVGYFVALGLYVLNLQKRLYRTGDSRRRPDVSATPILSPSAPKPPKQP